MEQIQWQILVTVMFGMYTGDGNSNGGITIADRNEVWLPQNGTTGLFKR